MKTTAKRTLAALAAAVMSLSLLAGCKGNDAPADTTAPAQTTQAAEESSATEETAADETTASEETTAAETTAAEVTDFSANKREGDFSLTALELSKKMGNGINLGNTHEAYGHTSYSWDTDPKTFERLWGQPNTTQEIITGMKAAGFDTVRVPVAWTNGMDYESGDYTINPAFLDRIEEVINYAINADMYVIVNDHWDGSWWGMFGSATEETRDKAMEMYISMWTQIAERYKDYPENLIFESANEELGDRLNDKDVAKDSGSLSTAECYETANKINQTFVDTVRATGGNNADRYLLIAGYNTDIGHTVKPSWKMPQDTSDSKLFVSVHYYTPADYCLNGSISHWGSVKQYDTMNGDLEQMTKFTEEGYGVIIGEYGVLCDGSTPPNDWDLWFNNFLDNCDLYNYVPVLWDCNALYNKLRAEIPDENVAELFHERSNAGRAAISMTEEQIQEAAEQGKAQAYEEAQARDAEKMVEAPDENTAQAWIMYQSGDWGISYSVGDTFDPNNCTDGIKATNPVITGEGEYTVALDFTDAGKPKGTQFCAIGVANGETLYPGYIIDIKSVKINDKEVELEGVPYTCSDDGKCKRVNLYNQWVKTAPEGAAVAPGQDASKATPSPLKLSDKLPISTFEVNFDFIAPAA